mmetsp:Transcript_13701/g.45076  ORF Transcript_13701/g.45076 Transcript_13701/m.45076 type:complete len:325 (-) Transcript_13701:633-1607(-)
MSTTVDMMELSVSNRATFGGEGSTLTEDPALESAASSEITSSIGPSNGALSRYELQGVIGSGKFSTVYRAKHMDTGAIVAIKKVQIFEIMDTKMRSDCINEVKLLQSLDHPHVIRYYDSFMEENELVIILEWCEGGDLGKELQRHAAVGVPLEEVIVWEYFDQIVSAVQHMHSRRMMHRDLKPSNVFVAADGRLKIGDLGLSRYFSSRTNQAQSMVGTPYYMSPECVRGQLYDWSSDVWSLGCLLYELGTLQNPFFKDGLNYYTLGKLITTCDYAPLPERLHARVRPLVQGMIQADPAARPNLEEVSAYCARCRAECIRLRAGA